MMYKINPINAAVIVAVVLLMKEKVCKMTASKIRYAPLAETLLHSICSIFLQIKREMNNKSNPI